MERSPERGKCRKTNIMDAPITLICANPAGEPDNTPETPSESWPPDTPGGRFYAGWADQTAATHKGPLIFFFQFLHVGGRWQDFLRDGPRHDIDVTVKAIYGHQQGAEIGYSLQKTGRPGHVYQSYFGANLRISLGVEAIPGNEHAAAKGLPGLWQTLEELPRHQSPISNRGDCGYGSETTMLDLLPEEIAETTEPAVVESKA